MAAGLTDYEKQRLENIRANAALLESLDLPAADTFVSHAPEPPKPKTTSRDKPRDRSRRATVKTEPAVGTRSSRRLREAAALDGSSVMNDAERTKIKKELEREERAKEKEKEKEREERRKWRAADREVSTVDYRGNEEEERNPALLEALKALHVEDVKMEEEPEVERTPKKRRTNARSATAESPESSPKKHFVPPSAASTSSTAPLSSLKDAYAGAAQIASLRVTSNRIYSMCVYPDASRELIFIGDKEGWLSVWDYKDDIAEEEWQEHSWRIKMHSPGKSVSEVRIREGAYVLTGAYDCSIRQLNFETGVSQQIVDLDLGADEDDVGERLVSSFDLTSNRQEIWVSDTRGGLSHRDLRENKFSTRRWRISNKKVGCVSLHSGGRYAVTAHFERLTRLWDLRMLVMTPPSSEPTEDIDKHIIAEYETPNCCTSAYWHPSGVSEKLLTTSYDDCIRIYDANFSSASAITKSFVPSRSIKHDTHTGRFTTVFKARFSPLPTNDAYPHFFVGNMKQSLDVFDGDGNVITRMRSRTVPAVAVGHPLRIGRAYGGAQGGHVYVFGKKSESVQEP
ncbi:WD40 repeat-like protein [Atractiella rhizophila]|nr:WD40 repeat-like protein [Atractiella rhizophila]